MRIRFDFGSVMLDAELLDTPTATAIAKALPITGAALTWGEEVYFEVSVRAKREPNARAIITPGEIAYWPDGHAIALGFGLYLINPENESLLWRREIGIKLLIAAACSLTIGTVIIQKIVRMKV